MSERKNKPGQGRKSPIKSESALQRISTRISVEAIAILDEQSNKAVYIDEAIKEKNIKSVPLFNDEQVLDWINKCVDVKFPYLTKAGKELALDLGFHLDEESGMYHKVKIL